MSAEQKPVLYGFFRSSASWRVRIALAWKGIDYEPKAINLTKGENLTEEYAKIVPLQKVPAFKTKDGKILTQSQAIFEYLEEAYPEHPMLPKDIYKKAEAREICQAIACDIHPIQNLGVLKRIAGDNMEKRVEWAKESVTLGFRLLEARLGQTAGRYCVGDSITMADMFLVPMIGNAKRWEVDMAEFPIVTRISHTLETEPAFKAAADLTKQPDCPLELQK